MKKLTKVLCMASFFAASLLLFSCGPKNTPETEATIVGTWKSQELLLSEDNLTGEKQFGYQEYTFNEDETYTARIIGTRAEINGVSIPYNTLMVGLYLKGKYTKTDSKIIFTDSEGSFDNSTYQKANEYDVELIIESFSSTEIKIYSIYNSPNTIFIFTKQ